MARATEKQLEELRIRTRRVLPGSPRFISREELQAFLNGGLVPKPMDHIVPRSDDPRIIQAGRLWDLGVGRELKFTTFEEYLQTISGITSQLRLPDREFPYLFLVETRLPLKMLCALGNVDFDGDDNTFQPWDARCMRPRHPCWIRMQPGRKNQGRSVADCRESFVRDELGLTALEGVSAYLQHPEIVTDLGHVDGYAMDLPGSVFRSDRAFAAHFQVHNGRAKLTLVGVSADARPDSGSASCRKV